MRNEANLEINDTCDAEHDSEGDRALTEVPDETLERAARIFRALADPSRLRLITILSQGEACVSELVSGDQQSTVSHRLRLLHSENLVVRKRQGKHIIYRLADDHVVSMIRNALEHAGEI